MAISKELQKDIIPTANLMAIFSEQDCAYDILSNSIFFHFDIFIGCFYILLVLNINTAYIVIWWSKGGRR